MGALRNRGLLSLLHGHEGLKGGTGANLLHGHMQKTITRKSFHRQNDEYMATKEYYVGSQMRSVHCEKPREH